MSKLLAPIREFTTFYVLCPKCDTEALSSTEEFPDGEEFKCKECGAEFVATDNPSGAENNG